MLNDATFYAKRFLTVCVVAAVALGVVYSAVALAGLVQGSASGRALGGTDVLSGVAFLASVSLFTTFPVAVATVSAAMLVNHQIDKRPLRRAWLWILLADASIGAIVASASWALLSGERALEPEMVLAGALGGAVGSVLLRWVGPLGTVESRILGSD